MAKNLATAGFVGLVAALVASAVVLWFAPEPQVVNLGASGTEHTFENHFMAGVTLGVQNDPSNLGFYQCASATVDPVAFTATTTGSGMVTTTAVISVTGALATDACLGSLSSATTTAVSVGCSFVGANGSASGTLWIRDETDGGSTLDLGSGTAKICALGPAR